MTSSIQALDGSTGIRTTMSDRRSGHDSDHFFILSLSLAFCAGVASTAFLLPQRKLQGKDDTEKDSIEALASNTTIKEDEGLSSGSFPVAASSFRKAADFASRIGELPKNFRPKTPWPWHRNVSSPQKGDVGQRSSSSSSTTTPDQAPTMDKKSSVCIGSIFGLDVGGTLAKLVYFEERQETCSNSISQRERLYRHSASARAVVMARRGLGARSQSATTIRRQSLSHHPHNDHDPIAHSLHPQRHSQASELDLKSLEYLRQESLPEDLQQYQTVVMDDNFLSHSTSYRNKPTGGLKKTRSMLNLRNSRHQALDRFYNFAQKLDSYREGVRDHKLSFYSRELGGEFHFIRFETRRMKNAMDLIRANQLHLNIREMGATGGGAHKYANDWLEELGIEMQRQHELDSLVAGMQFVMSSVVGECYTYRPRTSGLSRASSRDDVGSKDSRMPIEETESESDLDPSDHGKGDDWWWSRKVQRDHAVSASYPYLLVTIGTGVSILRVDGPRKYERISGSTIGGGTYLGLIRLLTAVDDFDDVMRLAEHGDPSKVDMLVGDIYGDNKDALEKLGLPASLVASSFGKLVSKEDPAAGVKEEDLARALLLMVTTNIGQVAYLNAQLHKTSRIYFTGNFLRENKLAQRRLSFAINYWSKGEMEALFMEHEGYFGALGAFLLSQGLGHVGKDPRRWTSQESMPSSVSSNGSSLHHRRSKTAQTLNL